MTTHAYALCCLVKTRVLQPQRDIDREKGRETEEGERERKRERERAGSSVVSIETLYCKTIY